MADMKTSHILKNWLEQNKMTATALAKKAGVNHTVVHRFLKGRTACLRVDTALQLVQASGPTLDIYELLGLPPRVVYVQVPLDPPGNGDVRKSTTNVQTRTTEVPSAPAKSKHLAPTESSVLDPSDLSTLRKNRQKEISAAKTSTAAANALTVFEHWVFAFGKNSRRVKNNAKRKRTIMAALSAGWTVIDLMRAIDGHAANSWRHAEPVRNELATLLRPENIEGGLEWADKFSATVGSDEEHDDHWDAIIAGEVEKGRGNASA